MGREGESCSFLFGEGDFVGLYHHRGKPGVFRAKMKVRDILTLSVNTKGNRVPERLKWRVKADLGQAFVCPDLFLHLGLASPL